MPVGGVRPSSAAVVEPGPHRLVAEVAEPLEVARDGDAPVGQVKVEGEVVFCVWSVRDLARGWASAATRNLTSLVSILIRMILSSRGVVSLAVLGLGPEPRLVGFDC